MLEHLESASLGINKITVDTLEDLIGRAAISSMPDGFGSNSRLGDGGRGGGPRINVKDEHGQPDSVIVTPVEATMFARERPPKDELSQRVKHVEKLITFIDVAAAEIQSNIGEVYRIEEEKKKRVITTPCLICEATAEKAGYCLADYNNWVNYGSPDRLRWEMWKKATTSVDGILMVPDCPPPGPGRAARRGPHKPKGVNQDLTKSNTDV